MVTDPSPEYMRQMSPLLCIDEQGKTDTDIQILFWKSLYEYTAAYAGQLHAAFGRLVSQDGNTPDDICQREDDMALFMDQFLTGQPVDILAHLRATYPTTLNRASEGTSF